MPDDEDSVTQGESDYSEQDVGNIPTRKRRTKTSGNEEWNKQQALKREREHPTKRVEDMEHAVKNFRIASSGDGLLRGGFGRLPANPAQELLDRVKDLNDAVSKFNLQGDNLNVSGSFDDGYTVTRENPCEQQQVNQDPT